MKTGLAIAVAHWVAVAAWGFWGWAAFWAAVGVVIVCGEGGRDAV